MAMRTPATLVALALALAHRLPAAGAAAAATPDQMWTAAPTVLMAAAQASTGDGTAGGPRRLQAPRSPCEQALTDACSMRTNCLCVGGPILVCRPCQVEAGMAAGCTKAEVRGFCDPNIPEMMTAAYKTESCGTPFDCVRTRRVPVPAPGAGEALLRVVSDEGGRGINLLGHSRFIIFV